MSRAKIRQAGRKIKIFGCCNWEETTCGPVMSGVARAGAADSKAELPGNRTAGSGDPGGKAPQDEVERAAAQDRGAAAGVGTCCLSLSGAPRWGPD